MTRPLAPLLLPLLAAVSAGAELASPFGAWEVRGAHVELVDDGGAVVGRLAAAGGPCPVAVGTELLRGTLLDDSLSAQVRLCLLAEECAAEEGSALAVLLVGKQLSGGVHSRKACAGNARSLVLRRSGTPQALRAPPGAERLSRTRAPKSPRQVPSMVARAGKERASPASPGEVAGHPVGEDQAPRYDARQARKLRSLSVDELLGAGKQQLEAGFFERARRSFQAAIVKTPSRVEAYNGVGVTFYARGDLDEALAWYKRALQVDPAFGDAYYNLGCVYALQGKKELAFRYLRLAALNHYAELAQLQADPDLASLRDAVEMRELEGLMTAEAR